MKLCGAGGGGFILCVVPSQYQSTFISEVRPLKAVKVELDVQGTVIL